LPFLFSFFTAELLPISGQQVLFYQLNLAQVVTREVVYRFSSIVVDKVQQLNRITKVKATARGQIVERCVPLARKLALSSDIDKER